MLAYFEFDIFLDLEELYLVKLERESAIIKPLMLSMVKNY
jgi:hypothetical protein